MANGKTDNQNHPYHNEIELMNAIKECINPEAVAVIHAYLQPALTRPIPRSIAKHTVDDDTIDRQVEWFIKMLVKLVGGEKEMARLAEEIDI